MSVILSFLLILFCLAGWWLFRHQLLSKPWLEQGAPDPLPDRETTGIQTSKIGLGVFLGVVGALFALFASAYFERMGLPDWRSFHLPRLLWVNTGMLMACSAAMHCSLMDARNGLNSAARSGLAVAGVAGLAFVLGQLAVWHQLMDEGLGVSSTPSVTFFYLLTGLHGLHILGGLIALAIVCTKAWRADAIIKMAPKIELCTIYWHFLLAVWLAMVVVMTGWANEIVVTCSQLFS